ncbi:glutaredoxin [Georgenia ruanii]|uniref:Glutaredoxin n=1 Tax=Georgenia ruanii TaxID=348442 RepID=A0A7J9UWB6_9MICO|nr:glutaredoxin [Georgenia ruanii]MPV88916.1 glutaredoxin [Georgenia ruanii]
MTTRITIVTTPVCHFQEEVRQTLDALARDYPLEVREVALDSREGHALVNAHRPAMMPLVLVDDVYLSEGPLARRSLEGLLLARHEAVPAGR